MVNEYFEKIKHIGLDKILLIFLAGVLLIYSNGSSKIAKSGSKITNETSSNEMSAFKENELEYKLEKILSLLSGVDSINVVITYEDNGEKINESTYSIKELTPKVCGVVVVFSGDKSVSKDIADAVKVLTDVEYNKIKVLSVN